MEKNILIHLVQFAVVMLLGYTCVVTALRCFGFRELPVKKRRLCVEKNVELYGESFTLVMGLKAIAWGVVVLCALYCVSLLYCAVTRDGISQEAFYKVWSHSDAVHYRNLAEIGYHDHIENGQHLFLVFFPLYPWLMRLLHVLISNYDLCGHLLSALSYVGGCYVLARLVTEEFGWRAGRMSLMLFSAYPFAFFFAGIYTESLFFLLSVTTFYFIRKHRYFWAGIFGALAALTRMQGVFLIFAGVVEYAASGRPVDKIKSHDWRGLWRDIWRTLIPLTITLVGTGIYLWLNYDVEGDPFRFSFYQHDHWSQYFVPLPKCLSIIWKEISITTNTKLSFTIWLPDLAAFLICLITLIYSSRRMPVAWVAYFFVCIVINFSLNWPLSCGRYIACAFPLPVIMAVASQRRPIAGQLVAVVFAILQGAYLYAYLAGTTIF